MRVHKGSHAGLLLPWGWVAVCLTSLLHLNNLVSVATETSSLGISPSIPTNESNEENITANIRGSTSSYFVPQDRNETTPTMSETTVTFTTTSGIPPGSGTSQTFVLPQTSPTVTLPTTSDNVSTSEVTRKSSVPSVNVSDYPPNNISSEMTSPTEPNAYTSSFAPSVIKGEIKCSGIREVRLTHGICLELSEASSCVSLP
nr:hematopoietic progenitor cell antigen CD34-like [Meriones unguiculatus]